MVVELVVARPKRFERGNRDHEISTGSEEVDRAAHTGERLLEMLDHVEHQDEVIPFTGPKAFVEWTDLNAVDPTAPGRHAPGVHFDPLDFAEARKLVEKEAVAAAD